MQKKCELYRGKVKTLYSTNDPDLLVIKFRDAVSALDGKRIEYFERKGLINNKLNYFIMSMLEQSGISTHVESLYSYNEVVVKNLDMIPLECVIRNRSAGSLVQRLGVVEGRVLDPPIFEIFLKNDLKHDPWVNESHCQTLKLVDMDHLVCMRSLSFKINDYLYRFFDGLALILVDFKLEFGLFDGKVVLGDEFSPDSARLWDRDTLNKMDKDIYRCGLPGLIDAYEALADRLGVILD
ncbi:phosphoribosylaminoimidazolesuccinocarboxamide synthase [Candidatus Erwinia haradaeae]|uniref:Phosphoribosylaminoimidazole-succinocarboxamide synthase n=1 Tax=Candidatus Erwinia haradaeae TaxID=1922217 RepID=A0A451D795_9GAMM|nr:phosphoribosylaminoimidazolesuccinocarboxamide synthase [Candidatus Erwinia haradaeae]VFP81729.1 Phosphoribosylaminoimidazole-succinocarboxamide synthase [Candidatus Erwinia haradaeae]